MNAIEIEEAISALAEQPFDAQEFPFAFLEAFGNKAATIKRLRAGATNKSDIGGVLQTNNIHIKTCGPGEVTQTLAALKASPATAKAKVKFTLATDGEAFEAEDVETGETVACAYADFPDHFGFFLPLAGISTVKQIRESAFDIRATSRLNRLYVELLKDNPEWGTAERRPDMNHFMARLIFCFFAEDTDIFNGTGLFTATVEQMSAKDWSITDHVIGEIFRAMSTPTKHDGKADDRYRKAANIPRWADVFPYVNGGLFSGRMDVPRFSKIARSYLLHIGNLDWKQINPDIFGSMIQAVADDEERGALGMHYTSVPNILKVLNPLFLDDLRENLADAGNSPQKLLNLRKRIAKVRVFDPACGSGNFLVIAYKQMREIEAEINKRRSEVDRPSDIPLTNFRGIELRDFPAEIARLALIIAEYQCDVLYRGEKLALAEFLPLDAQNWITCGNALRLDWLSICPPTGAGVKLYADDLFHTPLDQPRIDFENEGGETYICGNPPYLGGKKQDDDQKADMLAVFGKCFPYKNLDYICGFFEKASLYLSPADRAAFVSTSSINQGSHVPTLWPRLKERRISIQFAHRPFKWANNAKNNAGVFVTVLGIAREWRGQCALYDADLRRDVPHINSYLIAARDTIVEKESRPISAISNIITGNAAYDAQHLRLSAEEHEVLVTSYPEIAERVVRRAAGTSELLTGGLSWCLWIDDDQLPHALQVPLIREKIEKVAAYRVSGGEVARTLVGRPHQFRFRNVARSKQIVVPQVCSAESAYLAVGLFEPDIIVTHLAHVMFDPEIYNFAIVSSRLHQVMLFREGAIEVRAGEERIDEPTNLSAHVEKPWFRVLFDAVEYWYVDKYGSPAMKAKGTTPLIGAVMVRVVPFVISVPANRMKVDEEGELAWMYFEERLGEGEEAASWIVDGPDLLKLDDEARALVVAEARRTAEILRYVEFRRVTFRSDGDHEVQKLIQSTLTYLQQAAKRLVSFQVAERGPAWFDLQMANEAALKAVIRKYACGQPKIHQLDKLLKRASVHGVLFDASRLSSWPAFPDISDWRYGQGTPPGAADLYLAYRVTLDLVQACMNQIPPGMKSGFGLLVRYSPWRTKDAAGKFRD